MTTKPKNPLLSNRTYDVLLFTATVFLPALGALYFGLSQIWGLPNGEEVVGTIVLLDAFLGALLKVSDRTYEKSGAKYDGTLDVIEDPEGAKTVSLNLDSDPYDLDKQSVVKFRVESHQG